MTVGDDINTGIYRPASDTFAISTGGNERMRIDSSGLGIGKSPTEKLDVEGNIQAINTAGSSVAYIDLVSGGTWRFASNPTSGTNAYGLDIIKGSGGTDVKMAIDTSGNATFAGDAIFGGTSFEDNNSLARKIEIASANPVGLILNDTRDTHPMAITNDGAVLNLRYNTTAILSMDAATTASTLAGKVELASAASLFGLDTLSLINVKMKMFSLISLLAKIFMKKSY